ncbi:hypothetical protein C7B62_22800 [Pleurocapsa sp. CCALA 161]|uniref:hypothetical protein n=1 Tax=Pleurocapsa sp. CCALA 161 TaxID=2107688 RepID=UPI000D05D312|nr:hypothetical protein [Pleurocapsa sp. CCALA 161]PSB06452.1 hypothetical protein C7B62_22800 [Pleurocapsa sp. CCALA 161]
MFSLNTKSICLFFSFATILLLLKPLAANAQATERSGISNAESLGSSTIKSDAKKLAQFKPERVEVDVVEPVNKEANPSNSYLGIGGNIGFGGNDTAIGDGAFAVLGKGALSSHFALHPAVLFGDKNTILLPVTYGIPVDIGSSKTLYPFIGGGISIKKIFDDFDVNALATAGVDVPVTDRLTGTARFNLGFGDDTDTGLLLGIGYGT